jgi:hypothetical protein
MILFINTLITDKILPGSTMQPHRMWNRYFLNQYSSFDTFKYSLASLAPIYDWKNIILKISLDEEYKSRQLELENFIKEEFQGKSINIFWKRNESQSEWQESYDLLDDDLIWFNCNHDHICLDSNSNYLNHIISKMRAEQDKPISSCFTHWPENIALLSEKYSPKDLIINEDYATINRQTCDSINIISKSLYKKWWFSVKLPSQCRFPRPDWSYNMLSNFVSIPEQKQFIQFKEQSRHFDAYYHMTRNQCPALNIPDGFFENNMKISIGNENRINGYTWLNASITNYASAHPNGVDYKMLEEDMPLFWTKRISEIKRHEFDKNIAIENRLKSVMNMLHLDYTTPCVFKQDIKEKFLDVWKKVYTINN